MLKKREDQGQRAGKVGLKINSAARLSQQATLSLRSGAAEFVPGAALNVAAALAMNMY